MVVQSRGRFVDSRKSAITADGHGESSVPCPCRMSLPMNYDHFMTCCVLLVLLMYQKATLSSSRVLYLSFISYAHSEYLELSPWQPASSFFRSLDSLVSFLRRRLIFSSLGQKSLLGAKILA